MEDLPETEGLNLVELLDLLKPIPEPEPISMVPQTQGWLWLTLAVAMLCAIILVAVVNHRRASAYRREALKELQSAQGDPARIAVILRRTALVAYPRRQVASLSGENWLEFLSDTCPGVSFTGEVGVALTEGPYKDLAVNTALEQQCRQWVKHHRREERA